MVNNLASVLLSAQGLQLILAYSELDPRPSDWDESVQQVVTFVHRCITKLVACDASELALRLFLQAALVLDRVQFSKRESISYEFVSQVCGCGILFSPEYHQTVARGSPCWFANLSRQICILSCITLLRMVVGMQCIMMLQFRVLFVRFQALTLYEEGVSETRGQINAIRLITSTLCQMRSFSEENRNTLRTQCTRAATHLLRKHDQSRAVAASAHQFWPVRTLAREHIQPAIMINLSDKAERSPAVVNCSEQISDEELAKVC